MSQFGKRLRALCNERLDNPGLKWVSRRTGIKYTTLYGWVSQKKEPRIPLDALAKLAELLNISVEELLGTNGNFEGERPRLGGSLHAQLESIERNLEALTDSVRVLRKLIGK